jgi:hypothetical protein
MFRNAEAIGIYRDRRPVRWYCIFFTLLTPSFATSAAETKLECKLNVRVVNFVSNHATTFNENTVEIASVQILENEKKVDIKIKGTSTLASVWKPTFDDSIKDYQNRSTDTVWEVSSTFMAGTFMAGPSKMRNAIRIDRNTGLLKFSSETEIGNGSTINTSGTGYCSKVDTTKKKF